MIDRKQLKFAARGYIKAAKPNPWTVSMIACIITEILSVLSSALGSLMPLLFVELLVLPLSAFVTIYTGISYFLYYEALHGATYDSRISSESSAPADSDFSA